MVNACSRTCLLIHSIIFLTIDFKLSVTIFFYLFANLDPCQVLKCSINLSVFSFCSVNLNICFLT